MDSMQSVPNKKSPTRRQGIFLVNYSSDASDLTELGGSGSNQEGSIGEDVANSEVS
jgi:hypothetical protein